MILLALSGSPIATRQRKPGGNSTANGAFYQAINRQRPQMPSAGARINTVL